MKKTTVIAIPSSHIVITTIVYTLVATTFFEIDKALGGGANFIVDDNVKTMIYISSQQVVENPCKSPCTPDAEMCITMCAQTDKK